MGEFDGEDIGDDMGEAFGSRHMGEGGDEKFDFGKLNDMDFMKEIGEDGMPNNFKFNATEHFGDWSKHYNGIHNDEDYGEPGGLGANGFQLGDEGFGNVNYDRSPMVSIFGYRVHKWYIDVITAVMVLFLIVSFLRFHCTSPLSLALQISLSLLALPFVR